MTKKIIVKTGEIVSDSGIYRPSGGTTEYALNEGQRVPPNKEGKRQLFCLVHKAKHKKL